MHLPGPRLRVCEEGDGCCHPGPQPCMGQGAVVTQHSWGTGPEGLSSGHLAPRLASSGEHDRLLSYTVRQVATAEDQGLSPAGCWDTPPQAQQPPTASG